jgi:fumarate hydratase subunit alpha
MKEIKVEDVIKSVKTLCMDANYNLGEDILNALNEAEKKEESPLGKEIIKELKENAKIAREEKLPICQDTGFAVFFIDIGDEVIIKGGNIVEAINEGVRQGYREGYLRKSILSDPLKRINTNDNTPAVIHFNVVPGDKLKIIIAPKGGGSENMSGIKMLAPSEGVEGIKKFVIDRVREAGSNPCPPIIVGIGIGGTFEKAAIISKKALLRPLGSSNPDPFYADLEKELLGKINNLGIGPQGLGGRITALGVHIETYPCHIASLPVAINIQCHASRHKEIIL